MNRFGRFATTAVVSGSVSLAGLGLATATSQAEPAFGPSYQGGNCPGGITCTHWCPGDPLLPGSQAITWDWNVCHDWYWNSEGTVDVAGNTVYPWHGAPHQAPPPPPPPPPAPPPPPPSVPFCHPHGALIPIGPVCP